MSTPRGKAPHTKTTANGRKSVARVPKDLATSAAQPPGPAEAAPKPGLLASLGLGEAAGTLRFLSQVATRHPQAWLQTVPQMGLELVRVGLGKSEVAPAKGDRRFADPAWQQNPMFRATMQTYLTYSAGADAYVDNLGLESMNVERMRFGVALARESLAPTNFFWANPAALKRCFDTGGGSVRKGMANMTGDLVHNHGMPSMVDLRPFKKGQNIAFSPGAVIYRNEVFELIQYTPQSDTVYERPILMVPPQVNKYYALDLSPGRSLYEYLLQRGIQVYGISWRNPTGKQRDWNFDTYVQATIGAIDIVREVSGSPDVNLMGGCLGGMTAALTQAHLAALGEEDRIHSSTMFVTLLDTQSKGRMFLFGTPAALSLAKLVTVPTGTIDGWQMGSMFAWLRPNDLVWNYWVNNYLLGQDPPAFDILAWNADTTRLTTGFHHQLLDMVTSDELAHPGALTILGTPIDLSRITTDTYVAAGLTDHITPWDTCYKTTQMVSGHSQFVLCSSGHIQTVVADPKHRGLGYFLNPDTPPSADDWLKAAERHEGSWWDHWVKWLAERSGEQSAAPAALGSTRFPPREAAPGTYVYL
jgi:poly[(R)-3-hydroxyalkanoate] polymerase subunit PhaC